MSSTTPWKFTNGPSMTRTLSPRWNTDFGLGFSAPASICRMMSSTCSCESGTGLEPEPTNPVTLELTDGTWDLARSTPKGTGFVGSGAGAGPPSRGQGDGLMRQMGGGAEKAKP